MDFKDQFTTKEKKDANPLAEKGKSEVTNDAYAQCIMMEKILKRLSMTK